MNNQTKVYSRMAKKSKLTPKQDRFCREYMIDLNATQAAIRSGYSKKTAKEQAYGLLTKLHIQQRVTELNRKRQEATGITAEKVLREAARIAFADVGEAFNDDGSLKLIHEIPKDIRRAMSSLEVVENWEYNEEGEKEISGELKKVKFWSKDKQIENLFKHCGLFEKDNEQSRDLTVAEIAALMMSDNG